MPRGPAVLLVVAALLTAPALAADTPPVSVKPGFRHALPNVPGKVLRTVVVSYAPGAKSGSHRHAKSAFIYAHVLSGAIRSQVDDQPARVYRAGESWHELPGAHHVVSENASATEPAELLAVFVVDEADEPLTIPDVKETIPDDVKEGAR